MELKVKEPRIDELARLCQEGRIDKAMGQVALHRLDLFQLDLYRCVDATEDGDVRLWGTTPIYRYSAVIFKDGRVSILKENIDKREYTGTHHAYGVDKDPAHKAERQRLWRESQRERRGPRHRGGRPKIEDRKDE